MAGGDPKHLVMEIPGGKGQPLIGDDDEPVRQVALHLNDKVKKRGPDWAWIDTWTVKKDIEHGGTDNNGWEYCDSLTGMRDKNSPDMCRGGEKWVGEYSSGLNFRRKCWTRTQRRYLTTEAQEAADIESQIGVGNVRQLAELCKRMGIWDRIPIAGRTKPRVLRSRLRRRVSRLTANLWSLPCNLPLSGDTQLNIPTLTSTACVNVQVTASTQGTLLAVLTEARQPHFSLDNRSGIPLQGRIQSTQNQVWFDVPVSKGGVCTDVWEGDSGAGMQLRVAGSDDAGVTVPMNELGEKEPWEVVCMTPQGPTTIALIPSVVIQREAKTLVLRRAAARAQGGKSQIVGQFSLNISLAGFGLSVVNRDPKELMYMSCTNVRISQEPVMTLRVHPSRLNNVKASTENLRTPKLILRLGQQEHETAAVETTAGFINYKDETANFHSTLLLESATWPSAYRDACTNSLCGGAVAHVQLFARRWCWRFLALILQTQPKESMERSSTSSSGHRRLI